MEKYLPANGAHGHTKEVEGQGRYEKPVVRPAYSGSNLAQVFVRQSPGQEDNADCYADYELARSKQINTPTRSSGEKRRMPRGDAASSAPTMLRFLAKDALFVVAA